MARPRLKAARHLPIAAIAALVAPLVTCHPDNSMGACDAVSLVFTVQPSTPEAGTMLGAVRVEARDASAHLVTCFNDQVTLSLTPNADSAILAGGTTVSAVGGVAVFRDLRIDRAGNGYTLSAMGAGLNTGTSATFDVIPGPASRLVFVSHPGTTLIGVPIAPSVVVVVQDSFGNVATNYSDSVTMVMGMNPTGDSLDGTTTVPVVAGHANFTNLQLDEVAAGYTLVATSGALAVDTSSAFNVIAPAAVRLAFAVQPRNVTVGTGIAPAVVVTAQDSLGATATDFIGNVTIAIGTNPVGGTLTGTTTVAAIAGVATFGDLAMDKVGSGYTLVATSGTLLPAASVAFNVMSVPSVRLVFTVQPSNVTAGAAITPAVAVAARDSLGATVTSFTGPVTIAISTNPGGGVLSGTLTVAAASGVATFTNLSIDKSATGYVLIASAAPLASASSATFNVAAGAVSASKSTIASAPSTITASSGTSVSTITVTAKDAFGNPVQGTTVVIAASGTGNNLTQPASPTGANGATTGSVSATTVGSKTVSATINSVVIIQTATVMVTPAAAGALVFTGQPTNTTPIGTINGSTGGVVVSARDPFGNTATSFTGLVTIAIGTNPAGGTLSGTMSVAAVAGVATFSALSIDKVGTGYTLSAASSGLTGATSTAFDITVGAATKLAFTVQPGNTVTGGTITPAVQVTAQDVGGNTATSFTGLVTIAIGTNPAGGILSGTMSVGAVAGVATFSTLSIDKVGMGYTLSAAASGLTAATSTAFDMTGVSSGSQFGHAVIVVEENHNYAQADSAAMPYLHSLIAQGGLATEYYANTHPSIGNYFWLTTGQLITNNDGYSQTVSSDNIVRQLVAAGKTWKSYAEDLPSVGFTGQSSGLYARKHNPLSFFSDVVNDTAQIKRLVPFTQFATDLAGDTLPNYAFVVPNLCNDAHNCSLQTADTWLQAHIAPLLTNPSFQADGLLIIVFDEADTDNTNGGGRVVWAVISPKAKPGFTSSTLYQHENTLRLMAEGLGLTSFPGAAASASNMAEFFNP